MPKTAGPKKAKKKANLRSNFVFFCSCCAAAIVLFLSGINLQSFAYTQVLGAQDEAQAESPLLEVAYWESLLEKSPTYFDGWVELSYLLISLGNKEAAAVTFNKAVEINPNSEKISPLRALLEK